MNQITVIHPDGATFNLFNKGAVCAPTKATQKMALLSDDLLSITVTSATPLGFVLGDIVNVYGKGYRLNQLPQVTKQGERLYTYELQLEGAQYDLLDVTFQLPDSTYGENLYGDLADHVSALAWNLERVYGTKWVVITSLTGTAYKNLTVTGKNCLQVAQELCSQYDVEFKVTISGATRTMEFVEKVGTTIEEFTLKYGYDNGLYQLQRTNVNNAGVTTRLFCYGSSENLGSGYRHTKLCLPGKSRLTSYVEDSAAVEAYGVKEGEKTFSDIRPERVGHVTAVVSGDVLSFKDSSMDFDLNEKDSEGNTKYLIADTVAQIKFVSGNLGGYTFDLRSYDHATKKFTINQFTDENGVKFPDAATAARQFSAANGGDEYIITEINLPDSYKTAAENKLKEAGENEIKKICQPQVSYKLTLDEYFFIDLYGRTDAEILHVGDSLMVEDAEIGINRAVRITRIERDLLRPHSYDITLSDTVTKTTTVKVLNELTEIGEVIQNSGIADTSKMRRRWMATKELQEMVFDPDGYFDTEKIKPLSIETSMLTVAAVSQQFTLIDSLFAPNVLGNCNSFYASGCKLAHYGLFEQITTFTLTGCTYSAENGNALDTTTAYYIYARCSKQLSQAQTGTGTIILSTEQHKADETNYYYFLIGVLNSAVDGVRAISLTYGATTINGAFITTGRITSQDDNNYLDLDNGQVVMGNGSTKELSWNKNNNGKLLIKGGLVVNDGNVEGTIGLFRGVYSATATYYPGDEVTYTDTEQTCTYRRIGTGGTRGIAPTNTTYWQVVARGAKGTDAVSLFKSTAFVRIPGGYDISSDIPTGGTWESPVPTSVVSISEIHAIFHWSDYIPAGDYQLWAVTRTFYSDNRDGTWSQPRKMTDTETYDVEFSDVDENPGNPTSNPGNWYDPNTDTDKDFTKMLWRAEREKKNGVWGSWVIVRIKGEKGDDAEYIALDGNTRTVKMIKQTNGTTWTPGTLTIKAVKVKGSTRTDLESLPEGYYMKMTRTNASTTATTGKLTDVSFSLTTGNVFGTSYDYARMDLYDDNDQIIASFDCSLSANGEKGADAPYYKYKYQWSGSRTAYPTPFDATALNAGSDNWKDTQPAQPGTLYYLWRTTGKVSADGSTLVENWSTPVRVTPTESSLKVEVRGTMHDGVTGSPEPAVKVYGENKTGSFGRGHNLKVLNASDLSVVFEGSYDTYTDTRTSQTATTQLYNKLQTYASPNYIILVYSYDAISMFSKLYGLLQKFGCSYRKPEYIGQRMAFAFIGRWGLQPGQGYTKYSLTATTVDIAASVIDGELITNGADGEPGENIVDNSEVAETYNVTDSSGESGAPERQIIRTSKYFPTIPEGQCVSGQARITLKGCTFPTAGSSVLVYFGSDSSWPTIGYLTGIKANGTYDLKQEFVNVETGNTGWNSYVHLRLNNFYTGGTITIERVKVEVGAGTEWTPSANDRKGAATPYQGVYDSTRTYYGTLRRTDVVKYNDVYYVARADVGAFINKLPTNTDYWNEFGAQFESAATKLFFAEFAYVENLGVRDLQTAESGKRVHISGDENAMTIYDADGQTSAVFSGDQFTDSQLFGGADMQITPTNTNHVMNSGDALHPDMTYNDTLTNSSFTFSYAGVLTGRVVIAANFTKTLVSDTTHSSRVFYVQVVVIVDGTQVGLLKLTENAGSQTGSDSKTVDFSVGLAAGTHTIKTRVQVSVPYYTSGSLSVTAKSTFTNVKASADVRMARYFANGQAVGCSSSQYIETLIENNKLLHKIRAGNCGIQLKDGTMQIMIAGVWYTCSRDSSTGALKLTSS